MKKPCIASDEPFTQIFDIALICLCRISAFKFAVDIRDRPTRLFVICGKRFAVFCNETVDSVQAEFIISRKIHDLRLKLSISFPDKFSEFLTSEQLAVPDFPAIKALCGITGCVRVPVFPVIPRLLRDVARRKVHIPERSGIKPALFQIKTC